MSRISAQVSLYPLRQSAIGPTIRRAMRGLRQYGLDVRVSEMSTLVWGDEEVLFDALREMFHQVLNRWSAVALRRRLAGLFRSSLYETARFYGVGELRRLLSSLVSRALVRETEQQGLDGERSRILWYTTLFSRWVSWRRAKLPWGGFIAIALSLPQGT